MSKKQRAVQAIYGAGFAAGVEEMRREGWRPVKSRLDVAPGDTVRLLVRTIGGHGGLERYRVDSVGGDSVVLRPIGRQQFSPTFACWWEVAVLRPVGL